MDPNLMKQVAVELFSRFASFGITKVMTVEASGIAPALMLGYIMELPVIFAKKQKPSTMTDELKSHSHSFTKDEDVTLYISREHLTSDTAIRAWRCWNFVIRQVQRWWAWDFSLRKSFSMAVRC